MMYHHDQNANSSIEFVNVSSLMWQNRIKAIAHEDKDVGSLDRETLGCMGKVPFDEFFASNNCCPGFPAAPDIMMNADLNYNYHLPPPL